MTSHQLRKTTKLICTCTQLKTLSKTNKTIIWSKNKVGLTTKACIKVKAIPEVNKEWTHRARIMSNISNLLTSWGLLSSKHKMWERMWVVNRIPIWLVSIKNTILITKRPIRIKNNFLRNWKRSIWIDKMKIRYNMAWETN